jgi:hypothetical protein
LLRRDFVSSVCLRCVLFAQSIKEVNAHTSGQTSGNVDAKPNRSTEVKALLINAEALLKKLDGTAALNLFEQAAQIVHSSEVEVGIVRAHLQAGQFQRAISFGAHASGAHLDEAAPSLLYVHLLKISGQTAHAEKLLNACRLRFGDAGLKSVKVKLSPYFDEIGLPAQAKMLGSGLRLPNDQGVAVPFSMLRGIKKFWVRLGSGVLAIAMPKRTYGTDGLAILRVENLPNPPTVEPLIIARKAVFPGSVAFVMQFEQQLPLSWPLLVPGFIGEPSTNTSSNASLTERKGRRFVAIPSKVPMRSGATVFDQTGMAIGLVAPFIGESKLEKWQLIPCSELGLIASGLPNAYQGPKLAAEQIYQLGQNNMVQVIGIR